LKVCIDATPIGLATTDKGGVYRYIFELIRGLSSAESDIDYTLFFNFFRKEHLPVFNETTKQLNLGHNFHIRLSRFPSRLRRIINLPVELLAGRFDVFHGCFDCLPMIAFGRGVVSIHDIRYLEDYAEEIDNKWIGILRQKAHPSDFYVRDYYARFHLFENLRTNITQTLKKAFAIITVSEFSRNRIIEKLGVSPEKIHVIYHGLNSSFKQNNSLAGSGIQMNYSFPQPYILFVGKFDPLKNLFNLIFAFKKLINTHKDYSLVFIGPLNWFYFILLDAAEKIGIKDRLIFKGYVTDDELIAAYKGASLFCMPSLYEGFGIPLIEAMACGVPVVASSVCSIPEVVGDAGLLVDPMNADSIAEGIYKVLSDEELRNNLIQKGFERARLFSWEKTVRETIKIYRKVHMG